MSLCRAGDAYHSQMTDTRSCAQCHAPFVPRREHARFCSARCRTAWNRANQTDLAAEKSALEWSVTAMREVTERLPETGAEDPQKAFAVIGEAVWWVTIVDATMIRHHQETYDAVLTAQTAGERRRIEGTLGGLRFVRNRMAAEDGQGAFVGSAVSRLGTPGADDRVADWTWRSMPEPPLRSLPRRGREWERTRHQAYQDFLAGRTMAEVFGRAAVFLSLAAATATATGSGPGTALAAG
jgi:hypothetical protein